MNQFSYPATLQRLDTGVRLCSRDFGGLVVEAACPTEAMQAGSMALADIFTAYMQDARTLPLPSKALKDEIMIAPPADIMAKAALHMAVLSAGVSKVDLAKRLGVDEKEVRRLLDPHYKSKLPRIAQAIELLGKRLVIGLDSA